MRAGRARAVVERMRPVAAGWCLAFLVGWGVAAHADTARSVKVRVVALEAVPPDLAARRVAVRVFIGSKRLDQTPWSRGSRPVWNRSLRAFTAVGNPLVFEVVGEAAVPPREPAREEPPATAPRPSRTPASQDRTLATGFEELVGDWEAGPSPPPARPPRGPPDPPATSGNATPPSRPARPPVREGATTLCRASLAWPPSDGEHRLACGSMVLVVHTTRIKPER